MNPSSPQNADQVPLLLPDLTPPAIHGAGALTKRAFRGEDLRSLLGLVDNAARSVPEAAASLLDTATILQLNFQREQALQFQADALRHQQVFRVRRPVVAGKPPVRVLALVAPGDLMANTPLDFITNEIDVQLDLLFVGPGLSVPPAVPDHDVAFFAASDADPQTLALLQPLYEAWPRPALNAPELIARLSRDGVSRGLAGVSAICSPTMVRASRAQLLDWARAASGPAPLDGYPVLVRPVGSHGGNNLAKVDGAGDLADYLAASAADEFFVGTFVDYRAPDGLHHKYRVACIDGVPHLCHVASSEHWMVHYLNAGMDDSAGKRANEAWAMAHFEGGFARRHQAAFDVLNRLTGLDYYQLDCAETRDGRLLVFETDVAGIIHAMDPPDVYPYKAPQMRRVFAAFEAMLRRRAAPVSAPAPAREPACAAG